MKYNHKENTAYLIVVKNKHIILNIMMKQNNKIIVLIFVQKVIKLKIVNVLRIRIRQAQ